MPTRKRGNRGREDNEGSKDGEEERTTGKRRMEERESHLERRHVLDANLFGDLVAFVDVNLDELERAINSTDPASSTRSVLGQYTGRTSY